jgi:hypothetical protein
MKEQQFDLFDLILDKIKNYKGYTVVGILKDADPGASIVHFDTKAEFDQEFCIVNRYGHDYPEQLPNSTLEFYCDDGPYLVIDGKFRFN